MEISENLNHVNVACAMTAGRTVDSNHGWMPKSARLAGV